jgi:hypothetical protein
VDLALATYFYVGLKRGGVPERLSLHTRQLRCVGAAQGGGGRRARRPAAQANTMDAFIERVICKVYHHATPTLAEYFRASRAHTHIPLIRTPTLFLGAADDPFLGALPAAEASANPYTLLALTARCARPRAGGRLGGRAGCACARTRCMRARLHCVWACRVAPSSICVDWCRRRTPCIGRASWSHSCERGACLASARTFNAVQRKEKSIKIKKITPAAARQGRARGLPERRAAVGPRVDGRRGRAVPGGGRRGRAAAAARRLALARRGAGPGRRRGRRVRPAAGAQARHPAKRAKGPAFCTERFHIQRPVVVMPVWKQLPCGSR